MSDPASLSLQEALRALRTRRLSAQELTEACLQRVAALDPTLRAFAFVDEAGASRRARSAGLDGPLGGIPVGVKDLVDVGGLPTAAGSRVLAENRASLDAPVVGRLSAAGVVILGKTTTQEFAYGVITPGTANPWDTDRIPGGSSGGSAVAVATGMCPGAIGTDTAGSIRIPAALCGVSGLKPRPGTVPMDGIIPLSWTLDCCGPIARTVEDLVPLWAAMTGGPVRLPAPGDIKVGFPDGSDVPFEVTPDVGAALEEAAAVFAASGISVQGVSLPSFALWDAPRMVVVPCEALAAHREAGWYPQRTESYGTDLLDAFRHAEGIDAATYVSARRRLEVLRVGFMQIFNDVDVVLLPATPFPAPRIDEFDERPAPGERRSLVRALTQANGAVNCCGLAAVAAPCGFSGGLPLGLQLIARDEATALAVGTAYQRSTDWHLRRPPSPG
ncbi:MAG: amidase [Actinomycetota bacterium]|nr:amidase [Actinomycetota bacterium]